jgi:hypothetical protein
MAKMIKLGRSVPDYSDEQIKPTQPEEPEKTKMVYPDLYVESTDTIDLPDKGRAVIEFEVTKREVTKRKGKPTKHEVTIEVKSITPQGKKEKKTTSEVLDELLEDAVGED